MFQSFFWDQKTLDGTAAQCPRGYYGPGANLGSRENG